MNLSKQNLKSRRESLVESLMASTERHKDLKERCKEAKQEIDNTKGAILELEHLLDESDV